jgi:hypothetical protein
MWIPFWKEAVVISIVLLLVSLSKAEQASNGEF